MGHEKDASSAVSWKWLKTQQLGLSKTGHSTSMEHSR